MVQSYAEHMYMQIAVVYHNKYKSENERKI